MLLRMRLIALCLPALLAGCGQPTPPPQPAAPSVSGTLHLPPASPFPPLGAAMLVLSYEPMVPVSLTEVQPGRYSTSIFPIVDNKIRVELPAADDLSAITLSPAEELFAISGVGPLCALTTSVPDVKVTRLIPISEAIMAPSLQLFGADASSPVFTSPTKLDYATPLGAPIRSVSWVYATSDVHVATHGACTEHEGLQVTIDANLKTGWNQVTTVISKDPAPGSPLEFDISDSEHQELYFQSLDF